MLSLKHTVYNLIIYLRSLKLTYINISTLRKQLLYSTNKQQKTEIFNYIYLALNSKKILQINSRIKYILINYTFSKHFQAYLYTYKRQKKLYVKVWMNKKTNIKYPISIISLNIVYVIYKLINSKHPIYIYNQIYKNL